jgi:hypothetical protein
MRFLSQLAEVTANGGKNFIEGTEKTSPGKVVSSFVLSCLSSLVLSLPANEHAFEWFGLFKGMLMSMLDTTRQDKTRQDNTRQDKTRQD